MNNLRQRAVNGEKLCEIEASAKWYAKNQRETLVDRGLSKSAKYLTEQDLIAVPFDQDNGFRVMRKSTYQMILTAL